jgi:hypothetical protein
MILDNSYIITYTYKYPHTSITADCVIFGFDGISIKVLRPLQKFYFIDSLSYK